MALVFASQLTPDLASLVKAIDEKAAASGGKSSAFVVFFGDEKTLRPQLEAQAAKDKLSIPLTLPVDDKDAASKFKLTPGDKMPVNVLLYRDKVVKKAFNFDTKIKDADIQAVSAAYEEVGR